jgi:hypothetical protein
MKTRRLTAATGMTMAVVAVAGVLTAAPAVAANGVLRVSGNVFHDPSGCYHGQYWPLVVDNQTDQVAVVFDSDDGGGQRVGQVGPRGSSTFEFGASVFIR